MFMRNRKIIDIVNLDINLMTNKIIGIVNNDKHYIFKLGEIITFNTSDITIWRYKYIFYLLTTNILYKFNTNDPYHYCSPHTHSFLKDNTNNIVVDISGIEMVKNATSMELHGIIDGDNHPLFREGSKIRFPHNVILNIWRDHGFYLVHKPGTIYKMNLEKNIDREYKKYLKLEFKIFICELYAIELINFQFKKDKQHIFWLTGMINSNHHKLYVQCKMDHIKEIYCRDDSIFFVKTPRDLYKMNLDHISCKFSNGKFPVVVNKDVSRMKFLIMVCEIVKNKWWVTTNINTNMTQMIYLFIIICSFI